MIYSKRFVIILRYDGRSFYMYKSSGLGGKNDVPTGEFYYTNGYFGGRMMKLPDWYTDRDYKLPNNGDYQAMMRTHNGSRFFQDLSAYLKSEYS